MLERCRVAIQRLKAGMMRALRPTAVAAELCQTVVVAGGVAVFLVGVGSVVAGTGAYQAVDVEFVPAPQATLASSVAPDHVDAAKASDPAEAVPDQRQANLEPAAIEPSDAPAEATLPAPAPENMPDPLPDQPAGSVEILDECFAVNACVDRYLFALYERTPKEDTIRVSEQRKVQVRKKKKMVTVTRTFTKLVDEDFGWKDPKAADRVRMSMSDYVIGGMDRAFKLRLFHLLYAADEAGLAPGITSAFRDDYRQSLASGLHAADNRSYHGGSLRGGYGHGVAIDVVSVKGATRGQRYLASESLWKWIDAHEKEFGIGRPYLDHDPPHLAPIDGQEWADHRGGTKSVVAGADAKKPRAAGRDEHSVKHRVRTAKS